MKTVFQLVLFCLILRGVTACQHTPIAALEPTIQELPDTCGVKNVAYKSKIETLFSTHCYTCHSGRGASKGINFEGYGGLKWWLTNDSVRILGVIRKGEMPPTGKIPDCQILQLQTWIQKGMPY